MHGRNDRAGRRRAGAKVDGALGVAGGDDEEQGEDDCPNAGEKRGGDFSPVGVDGVVFGQGFAGVFADVGHGVFNLTTEVVCVAVATTEIDFGFVFVYAPGDASGGTGGGDS